MDLRTRTRGSFKPGPTAYEEKRFQNCSDPNWSFASGPYPSAYVGVVETMRDLITPGFRRRVAKGEVIFNNMFYEKRTSIIQDGGYGPNYTFLTGTPCPAQPGLKTQGREIGPSAVNVFMNPSSSPGGVGHTKPIPYLPLISAKDIDSFTTEATTECLAKRGKADNNLFESVAEYKEAVKLLRHPTEGLYRFIKLNGKKIKTISPEKAWLTYRYGIRPLISDITSIISGLQKKIGSRRVTSRSNIQHGTSDVHNQTVISGAWTGNYNVQTVDNVQLRAMSLDEFVATTGSNIGFTTKGLITVPWELVPFSFVADWFLNVGDYLNAIAPSPGYKQLGSCITIHRTIATNFSSTSGQFNPITTYSTDDTIHGSFSSIYSTKTRLSLGAPGVVIKSDFRFDHFNRAADALALASVVLEGLFSRRR